MNDMHADAQRGFPNNQPTSCKEQKNTEEKDYVKRVTA